MNSAPWRPSKPVSYLIAALTIWPPIYLVLFMSAMAFSFTSVESHSGKPPSFDLFKYIFPLHFLTMLLMFALTAIYVIHAFRNDKLGSDKRILWVIVLFFGNMLAFPIYWWFYLRPSNGVTPPPSEQRPSAG